MPHNLQTDTLDKMSLASVQIMKSVEAIPVKKSKNYYFLWDMLKKNLVRETSYMRIAPNIAPAELLRRGLHGTVFLLFDSLFVKHQL